MPGFTEEERSACIGALNSRLKPAQLRALVPKELERLVARIERRDGLYRTRVVDDDLADFLVDLHGPELLRQRDVRKLLVSVANDAELLALHSYMDTPPARGRNRTIEEIVSRNWHPGKAWPRYFTSILALPLVLAGSPDGGEPPAVDEIEPYVPLPKLHDWQDPLKKRTLSVLQNHPGRNRAILSLPTGAGKTRVTAEAIVQGLREDVLPGNFVLWVAQSDELCEQAVEAFRQVWIDQCTRAAIKDPSRRQQSLRVYRLWSSRSAPDPSERGIIVASIQKLQSMCSRDSDSTAKLFEAVGVVLVDEAHHAISPSYSDVFRALGLMGRKPDSVRPMIGLTATPYRGDKEERDRLVARFYGCLLVPDWKDPIAELRERKVLAHMSAKNVDTKLRYSLTDAEIEQAQIFHEVPKSALNKIGKDRDRNALILDHLLDLPEDWPVLFFGCSVEHAQATALLLRRRGRSAAVVTADTPPSLRRCWVDEFRDGELQFLCNYGVLTTGFDAPKVRAVAIARPTTSVLLYEQMVGRGMRGPGNGGTEECLVIDFVDILSNFQQPMSYGRYAEIWNQKASTRRE